MAEQVQVTAFMRAMPDRVDDLIAVLRELAIASRAESGCVTYGFNQDLDDPTVIIAVETWRDAEAIAAHFQTPHFTDAIGKVEKLVSTAPVIHRCRMII